MIFLHLKAPLAYEDTEAVPMLPVEDDDGSPPCLQQLPTEGNMPMEGNGPTEGNALMGENTPPQPMEEDAASLPVQVDDGSPAEVPLVEVTGRPKAPRPKMTVILAELKRLQTAFHCSVDIQEFMVPYIKDRLARKRRNKP